MAPVWQFLAGILVGLFILHRTILGIWFTSWWLWGARKYIGTLMSDHPYSMYKFMPPSTVIHDQNDRMAWAEDLSLLPITGKPKEKKVERGVPDAVTVKQHLCGVNTGHRMRMCGLRVTWNIVGAPSEKTTSRVDRECADCAITSYVTSSTSHTKKPWNTQKEREEVIAALESFKTNRQLKD